MGGGGVMRAAAKVAGVGVVNAGLRGSPSVNSVEQPMASAARKATTASVVSVVNSSKVGDVPVAVQRPSWELDDWDFATVEEEINVVTGEKLPRVVFGGVPSFQEAKAATSELKDALDQLYLSPTRSGVKQGLIQIPNSDYLETKSCVAATDSTVASTPGHAVQAFKYLKESPAAQSVVASIASDPNVWNAVMQNKELVDFLQKSCAPYPSRGLSVEESVADNGFQKQEVPKSFEESSDAGGDSVNQFRYWETPKSFEDGGGNSFSWSSWFQSLFESMKFSLAELVGNIFGGPAEYDKSSPNGNEKGEGGPSMNFMNVGVGASLTGLAVMVIMVVVMKRV